MPAKDPPTKATKQFLRLKKHLANGRYREAMVLWRSLTTIVFPLLLEHASRSRWYELRRDFGLAPCDLVILACNRVQDRVLKDKDNFKPEEGQFEAWLSRVALNKWEDVRKQEKKKKQQQTVSLSDADEYLSAVDDALFPGLESPNPERELLAKEELEAHRKDLQELIEVEPELESLVFAVASGCSPKPIKLAEFLGWDVRDIYNLLKRLRRKR